MKDECHLLKNENFYELQILTNFEMDSIDPALFILVAMHIGVLEKKDVITEEEVYRASKEL